MSTTPEQARELLDGATPGPWELRDTDALMNGRAFHLQQSGKPGIRVSATTYGHNDDPELIAAAPDLAQTIAGMTEEWGVDANGDALFPVREEGHPMGSYFTPDRDEAEGVRDRMSKLNPHNNYLLIRRLISVPEVIDSE